MKMLKYLSLVVITTLFIACKGEQPKEISANDVKLNEKGIVVMVSDEKPYSGVVINKDENNPEVYTKIPVKDGVLEGKGYLYEGDKKMEEVTYKDGKMNGPVQLYFPNGKVAMQGELKDDVPEGKWEWYDENGNIVQSATFKNGIPDQESIFLAPGTEGVIEEEVTIEPEEAETAPAPAAENNK